MNKLMIQSQKQPKAIAFELDIAAHPAPPVIIAPTHDEIAKRAYDIYVRTGRKQGQCTQNWHQAELALSGLAQQNRSGALALQSMTAP